MIKLVLRCKMSNEENLLTQTEMIIRLKVGN